MTKTIASLCFVILVIHLTFSQELPNVIPPSPEAAEFQKYGEFPVDYSTGVPNISIPLSSSIVSRMKWKQAFIMRHMNEKNTIDEKHVKHPANFLK